MSTEILSVVMKFAAEGAGSLAFVNTLNAALGIAHGKVTSLNSTLGKLAISAGMIGGGLAILSGFKAPLSEAEKMNTAIAKFASFGMDDKVNQAASNFARATKVMGTSTVDMMNNIIEAQGVFRESGLMDEKEQFVGAKIMAPIMAKIKFAQAALGRGEMSADDDKNLLRFIEDRGGATDPNKATALAEFGFKLINSSGGLVKWSDLAAVVTRSSAVGRTITGAGIAKLEPVIAALGGSTTGSGLRTAYNQMMGLHRTLSKMSIDEFIELGLWDKNKIVRNTMGGVKRFNGNPLTNYEQESTDPVGWYTDTFIPAIVKKYGQRILGNDPKALADREREINLIFGGGSTGATVYTRIDQMLPNIMRSIETQKKALGIDDAVKNAGETLAGKRIDLQKNWDTLMMQTGEVILPLAIKAMTMLNASVKAFSQFATDHPTMFRNIVLGIGGLGVALTAFGAISFFSIGISAIAAAGPVLAGLGAAIIGCFTAAASPVVLAIAAVAALGVGIVAFTKLVTDRNKALHPADSPGHPNAYKPPAKQGFFGALGDDIISWFDKEDAKLRVDQKKNQLFLAKGWADLSRDAGNVWNATGIPGLLKAIWESINRWIAGETKKLQADTQNNLKAEAQQKAILEELKKLNSQNINATINFPNGVIVSAQGQANRGGGSTAKPSGFNGTRNFQNPGATAKR